MNKDEEKVNELKEQIEQFSLKTSGKNEEAVHKRGKNYRGQNCHYLDTKSLRKKKEK
jgi:hypothetical protein